MSEDDVVPLDDLDLTAEQEECLREVLVVRTRLDGREVVDRGQLEEWVDVIWDG